MTSTAVAVRHRDDTSSAFARAEELPERAFFAREYVAQYTKYVTELVRRVEHLVEEAENLDTESESALDAKQPLAALTRDTVWRNVCALQDCELVLADTIELFQQKIRVRVCVNAFVRRRGTYPLTASGVLQESVDIVASHPEQFTHSVERSQSETSLGQSTNSEYSSDSRDETDDDDGTGELPAFQDVEPVTKKKEALALNDNVTARVKVCAYVRLCRVVWCSVTDGRTRMVG